jgi:5'-methylthioadenosine nucleosidase
VTTPLFVVAMEAEAAPLRDALGLDGHGELLHQAFPARLWRNKTAAVAVNGTDPRFGVESIATQPAITTTLHAVEALAPSTVISAGTAGGFAVRGGAIGSAYLADRVVFHDRRIAIPGWDRYGDGDYPVVDPTQLATRLGVETGTVTTGNALDAPPVDIARMHATDAVAKDMEAAAVAWMCERLSVPFTALKVITDLVDDPEETAEQFDRNLATATARLAEIGPRLLAALTPEDQSPKHHTV